MSPWNPERRWKLRAAMMLEQSGLCFYCDRLMAIYHGDPKPTPDDAATFDHIIPMSVDPNLKRSRGNLVLACYECNNQRGDMAADAFLIMKRKAA